MLAKDKQGLEWEYYVVGDINKPLWIDIRQEAPDTYYLRGGGTAHTGDVYVSHKKSNGIRTTQHLTADQFAAEYEVV